MAFLLKFNSGKSVKNVQLLTCKMLVKKWQLSAVRKPLKSTAISGLMSLRAASDKCVVVGCVSDGQDASVTEVEACRFLQHHCSPSREWWWGAV